MKYGNGQFDYLSATYPYEKLFFQNAHKSISICELWPFIEKFPKGLDIGIHYMNLPEYINIKNAMESLPNAVFHTTVSFAFTIEQMIFLAQNGEREFKTIYVTE